MSPIVNKAFKSEKKVIKINKNLWDPMAAFGFALGISIVHLALSIVMAFIVKRVDQDKAATFGRACKDEADKMALTLKMYQFTHILMFFACVFREMYSTLSGKLAQFMRILEVLCYPLYIACILKSLEALSVILIRENTEDPTADLKAIDPDDV